MIEKTNRKNAIFMDGQTQSYQFFPNLQIQHDPNQNSTNIFQKQADCEIYMSEKLHKK